MLALVPRQSLALRHIRTSACSLLQAACRVLAAGRADAGLDRSRACGTLVPRTGLAAEQPPDDPDDPDVLDDPHALPVA